MQLQQYERMIYDRNVDASLERHFVCNEYRDSEKWCVHISFLVTIFFAEHLANSRQLSSRTSFESGWSIHFIHRITSLVTAYLLHWRLNGWVVRSLAEIIFNIYEKRENRVRKGFSISSETRVCVWVRSVFTATINGYFMLHISIGSHLLTTFTFTFGWPNWMAPHLGRHHSILFTKKRIGFSAQEMAETGPSETVHLPSVRKVDAGHEIMIE